MGHEVRPRVSQSARLADGPAAAQIDRAIRFVSDAGLSSTAELASLTTDLPRTRDHVHHGSARQGGHQAEPAPASLATRGVSWERL
jgi:hypothetical protein